MIVNLCEGMAREGEFRNCVLWYSIIFGFPFPFFPLHPSMKTASVAHIFNFGKEYD